MSEEPSNATWVSCGRSYCSRDRLQRDFEDATPARVSGPLTGPCHLPDRRQSGGMGPASLGSPKKRHRVPSFIWSLFTYRKFWSKLWTVYELKQRADSWKGNDNIKTTFSEFDP
ncbi:unnamed protein product [Arctogadus glacialis]